MLPATFHLHFSVPVLCVRCPGDRPVAVVATKDPILDIRILVDLANCLACIATKVDYLTPFPCFHTCKEDARGYKYNSPVPINGCVLWYSGQVYG